MPVARFNSSLVRLKGDGGISPVTAEICFNSSLVRLKAQAGVEGGDVALFQFQLGAIKGGLPALPGPPCHAFQFQLGAIKGRHRPGPDQAKPGFNSSLVRLKAPFGSGPVGLGGVSIPAWCD